VARIAIARVWRVNVIASEAKQSIHRTKREWIASSLSSSH
jgi:hypothetical protein